MLANLKRAALGLFAVLAVLGQGLAPAQAQSLQTPEGIALLSGGNACAGVTVSLNFVTNKYCGAGGKSGSASAIPNWTFTRASAETCQDSLGNLTTAPAGVPCITDLGLAVWESRTNSLLNSSALSTQSVTTTAAAWTLSFYGTGSVTLSGCATGTLSGTGVNNRVTLTVTATACSTTATVSGSVTNAQFEAGAFPTPYIPTTGATATRAADVASVGSLVVPSAYTLFATVNRSGAASGTGQGIFSLNDGSNANRAQMRFRNVSNNFSTEVTSASVGQWSPVDSGTEAGLGITQKVALALSASGGNNASGGVIINTVGALTIPVGATTLNIGAQSSGATPLNGYVKQVSLYPTAYSSAQLQALTQ